MGLCRHSYSLFTSYYSPSLVHTGSSTVRDAGRAHAAPLSPDAFYRGPEIRAATRFFQKAGQVRIDSGGRTGFANGRTRTVNGPASYRGCHGHSIRLLSLIHISEPTRQAEISYA